ncbi:unnamed protein product [Ostreobium quekettii]|uniref:TLC domain-containing protein n=1 Tax=Ostreobium quekettii TaxID=121088 RepID=A0A8S1ILA5_9CHLO|nr:unnamed protein product [Ostreobium quekettii]|eukprot:evm.model.scf_337.9 EVM.evm.TU.scf_337.9   scf_337:64144-73339(+)
MPRRVAVIGAGVSGLATAWLLNRAGERVTLYEGCARCGGHTLTDGSGPCPVDLGFQVYNLTTYPNLVGFLEELGIDTEPSDMSFALSLDGGAFEWASTGLGAVFAQRENVFNAGFWRMIWEVVRFGQLAPQVLEAKNAELYDDMDLGTYINQEGYGEVFKQCYLLPMCAAVWSVPFSIAMQYPVKVLVRFWVNHHLLDLFQRPLWRVVKNRSVDYVDRVLKDLPDVRTGQAVASVAAVDGDRIVVTTKDGSKDEFDAVVLATHSNTSLSLLGNGASADERHILSSIPYQDNVVYYHSDTSLMPKRRSTWASWNFLGTSVSQQDEDVCVTYWLNHLQNLPAGTPDVFATLNPRVPPHKDKTFSRVTLAHPIFTAAGCSAQTQLHKIQGKRGLYFAGAWCGYGFHEDGMKSAIAVAQLLGAEVPWKPISTSPKVDWIDWMFMRTFDRFAKIGIRNGSLRIILPSGAELQYGEGGHEQLEGNWHGRPRARATIRVLKMAFFRKIVIRHDSGFGEGYMDGDFEVDDIGGLLAIAVANAANMQNKRGALGFFNWMGDRLLHLAHLRRANTIVGSRKNIEQHYDAGNDMYKLFLDETMTYSSGIHNPGKTLQEAQLKKLDVIIAKAQITSTDNVLEIGCGWGSFAIRAAQSTGCTVTGLTISKAQLGEAQARVKAAGLEDRVKLMLCDYRQCPGAGTFDKVVSIEMIEAVGHENMDGYFATIWRMLKPGGAAAIQAISVPDERYKAYCGSSDFIREHIFPGGHLPCLQLVSDLARRHGMSVHDANDIGLDYAVTLRQWRASWEERKEELAALGYNEWFWKKYRFYFAYCEAAFDAKYIHNFQIVLRKDRVPDADVDRMRTNLVTSDEATCVDNTKPRDPVTQVLLAIYFFLMGICVSHRRYLWILPATSSAFATLLAAVSKLSAFCVPAYGGLSWGQKCWWNNNVTQLVFSCVAGSASLLCASLGASDSELPGSKDQVSLVVVCFATGFAGFQVWDVLRHRMYDKSPHALVHYTIMLCLFGSAAFKQVHVDLLSVALLAEWSSAVHVFRRLLNMAGACSNMSMSKSLWYAELVMMVLSRLLPHLWLLVLVASSPGSFAALPYYWMALVGLVYTNVLNVRRGSFLWGERPERGLERDHAD